MTNEVVLVDQIAPLLEKYGLGELATPLERLTNGWTNMTIKFSTKPDGKTYILRVYLPGTLREISLENIKIELDFIDYLFTELNLPVAPMVNPPGIFKSNNENYCVLFPFVRGIKHLDTPETPVRKLWQTQEIARFLGRMHSNVKTNKFNVIASNRCSVNFVEIKYELTHSCEEFQEEYPSVYERVRLILDKHTQSIPLISDHKEQIDFEKNLMKDLPTGYIHADIHDDNVLFAESGDRIAAVLDFDDMYVGPLLIDLAMTLSLWCKIGSVFKYDYAKEFLTIYQREREMSLTDREWNLLELFCYLTVMNQVLFVIESEHCAKPMEDMINELLLPIEHIAKEENMFLKKIR